MNIAPTKHTLSGYVIKYGITQSISFMNEEYIDEAQRFWISFKEYFGVDNYSVSPITRNARDFSLTLVYPSDIQQEIDEVLSVAGHHLDNIFRANINNISVDIETKVLIHKYSKDNYKDRYIKMVSILKDYAALSFGVKELWRLIRELAKVGVGLP
ncbi:MAG: hypothetical protein AAF624_10060 [Bacteroidota bacterium]